MINMCTCDKIYRIRRILSFIIITFYLYFDFISNALYVIIQLLILFIPYELQILTWFYKCEMRSLKEECEKNNNCEINIRYHDYLYNCHYSHLLCKIYFSVYLRKVTCNVYNKICNILINCDVQYLYYEHDEKVKKIIIHNNVKYIDIKSHGYNNIVIYSNNSDISYIGNNKKIIVINNNYCIFRYTNINNECITLTLPSRIIINKKLSYLPIKYLKLTTNNYDTLNYRSTLYYLNSI